MRISELNWWLDKRCHEVLTLLATGLRNYPEDDDDLTMEVINDELLFILDEKLESNMLPAILCHFELEGVIEGFKVKIKNLDRESLFDTKRKVYDCLIKHNY